MFRNFIERIIFHFFINKKQASNFLQETELNYLFSVAASKSILSSWLIKKPPELAVIYYMYNELLPQYTWFHPAFLAILDQENFYDITWCIIKKGYTMVKF